MKPKKIMTAAEVANSIQDGQTITATGFVASGIPEDLLAAIEKRFLDTGSPRNLTYFYPGSQGSWGGTGGDRFRHKGMTKRVIAAHYATSPNLGAAAIAGDFEAYNLPQGVLTHMFRYIAGKKPGVLTRVGLHTFVDPRNGGGKINDRTTEDLVKLVNFEGEEFLFFPTWNIDVALIKGSVADEMGNVSFHKEIGPGEATTMAQAAMACGGKVYVQVERIVKAGTLDARMVRIPGVYVDALIVGTPEGCAQTVGQPYDPSLSGEERISLGGMAPPTMSAKKIIGRRAALELQEGAACNLGIGAPESVAAVANEEGIGDYMTLTVEAGPVGGVPAPGIRFGAAINPDCLLTQPEQFDFYDAGGLDFTFLGMAQADEDGNINVSRFGPRLPGCGGFINITQNSKRIVFCGTLTAGGLETSIKDGKLVINQEGRERKFIKKVEQITFSGKYAASQKKPVLYVTERAVFELRADGVYLIEVAPGIDIQTQILDVMDFVPKMDGEPKLMDARIFREELMGLKQ